MFGKRKPWKRQPRTKKGRWKKKSKRKSVFGKGRKSKSGSGKNTGQGKPSRTDKPHDVSVSHLDGIDIKVSNYDESRNAENVAHRYRSVLKKSFTPKERKVLAGSEGIDVQVYRMDDKSGGWSKENGKHIITLDSKDVKNEETMIHETLHALQNENVDRPSLDKKLNERPKETEILREALTEAETLSRSASVNTYNLGYYGSFGYNKGKISKLRDRALLRDETTVKKGTYANDTYGKFDQTEIQYIRGDDGRTAKEVKKSLLPKK